MRLSLLLVTAAVAGTTLLMAQQAQARIQPEIVCWEPDIEFPVACDDDDD
jgi:hypothetical protein